MQEEADRTVKYVPGGSCVITASQKKECMTATATVRPIKGPDSPGRETTREGTLGLGMPTHRELLFQLLPAVFWEA